MNTRTKTNLNIGKGFLPIAKMINSSYRGGKVGIIFENEEDIISLSKALYELGNTVESKIYTSCNEFTFKDNIRYFIGVGSEKICSILRLVAGDNYHCYYCHHISPEFFSNKLLGGEAKRNFAEFAYFDVDKINIMDTKILAEGYATIISLLISLLDIYCKDMLLPFRDIENEVLIEGIKKFLFKGEDKQEYLKEMLRLIKNSVDYLLKREQEILIYRIKEKYKINWNCQKEFFIDYLLFYLGKIFTKWRFNDMLIPASVPNNYENISIRVLLQKSQKIADKMLDKEQLKEISLNFRGMGFDFEDINIIEAFENIISTCPKTCGFFNEINNMGVIENIINYEKHKRY